MNFFSFIGKVVIAIVITATLDWSLSLIGWKFTAGWISALVWLSIFPGMRPWNNINED